MGFFDSIGDFAQAGTMAKFFDRLDKDNQLAKTIIYNLNPADNELFATDKKDSDILNFAWHISGEIKTYLSENGLTGKVIDVLDPEDFAIQ